MKKKPSIDLSTSKIVITGGQGFLGKWLIKDLVEKRGVPLASIRVPDSKTQNLMTWENCAAAVKEADIVIHLAARVGGIGFNRQYPGNIFYQNLIISTQLMEAARLANVKKFVGIGTVCAYPKFTSAPFSEDDLWMGYPEETNAPYGLAKKMLLVQGQAYRQEFGFNSIYLLPANLYGPGDKFDPEHSHVIPALIRKVLEAKEKGEAVIQVWGTGKATREFLYVEDAAEGIALATQYYDGAAPVNLGTGREVSIKELVTQICEVADFPAKLEWQTDMPDGQPRRVLNIQRAKKEFGFTASTPFKVGLRRTIEWYADHSKKSLT
jgi:GDP-L-fucose synthase